MNSEMATGRNESGDCFLSPFPDLIKPFLSPSSSLPKNECGQERVGGFSFGRAFSDLLPCCRRSNTYTSMRVKGVKTQ